MKRYYKILKIVLGFSLILSAVAEITLSLFDTLLSDRPGLVLIYPAAFIYVYFLGKLFITWTKSPERSGAFIDFIMLSIIGMILPFGAAFFYYNQRHFDIHIGISIYLVVLWIINIIICFFESSGKRI
jgi:hypothetical protein